MKPADKKTETGMDRDRKEKIVGRVFRRIAGRYDRSNNLISLGLQKGWKRMLTGKLIKKLPENASVLDVCCGTGDIALMLAAKRPDLRITGLDFSPEMLSEAKRRRRRLRAANVRFLKGNALELPFGGSSFDAAVISFGLRNTADYGRTIREMKRVVKKGGAVACLDSFVPDFTPARPFYRFYFRNVMPLLGGGFRYRKEYRWLCRSTEEFLSSKELSGLFRDAGLGGICRESRMCGACVLVSGTKE